MCIRDRDYVGSNSQDRGGCLGISVGMMLFDLVKECLQKPYSDVICSVIIVTISWEVSLGNIIDYDTGLITNGFYFCIFDGT